MASSCWAWPRCRAGARTPPPRPRRVSTTSSSTPTRSTPRRTSSTATPRPSSTSAPGSSSAASSPRSSGTASPTSSPAPTSSPTTRRPAPSTRPSSRSSTARSPRCSRRADGNIYVAGQFKNVNGVAARYLVKIDPVTGAMVTAFNAPPNGMVYDLHLPRQQLYVGGTFTKIRNLVRTNFAARPHHGQGHRHRRRLHRRRPRHHPGHALRRHARRPQLVAIGNFTKVGGQNRQNAASSTSRRGGATVERLDHRPLPLRASARQLRHLRLRRRLLARRLLLRHRHHRRPRHLDRSATRPPAGRPTSPAPPPPTWVNYTGGDSLTSVAITGPAVYVAGHQRWANNPQGADRRARRPRPRRASPPSTRSAARPSPGTRAGTGASRVADRPHRRGPLRPQRLAKFAGEFHPRLTYLHRPAARRPFGRPTSPCRPTSPSRAPRWTAAPRPGVGSPSGPSTARPSVTRPPRPTPPTGAR